MADPRCTCGNTMTFQKHDWWCKARNPEEPSMTQEQDIVERLHARILNFNTCQLDPYYFKSDRELDEEAAQTIAALRAERDDLRERIVVLEKSRSAYVSCYEAAQAAVQADYEHRIRSAISGDTSK